MKRLLLLIPIAALALAFFTLGMHQHMTLDAFNYSGEVFDDWYQRKPLLVIAAYFALFAFLTLFLPVAALMTVIAGALFGFWKGVLVASFAASLAATLAFFLSRFIFHDRKGRPASTQADGRRPVGGKCVRWGKRRDVGWVAEPTLAQRGDAAGTHSEYTIKQTQLPVGYLPFSGRAWPIPAAG